VRSVSRPAFPLVFAFTVFLGAAAARASGPLLFQHGGRPTAQVGAFVARAGDAGALDYNPAAIARLQGSHYQLGFDYTAPVDEYESATGSFEQDKLITESPALYATWHLPKDYYPLAFGIGVDHRAWYLADWAPALFPGRFLTRVQRLQLWSVHPVVAYELGDRWSVGAGLRYYLGEVEEGRNQVLRFTVPTPPGAPQVFDVEVERTAKADVDGQSIDLGVHYAAERWGWGLTLDSGGKLKGNGDVRYEGRDVPSAPGLQTQISSALASGSTRQSFELPPEARTGFWFSAGEIARFELDLAWTGWSAVGASTTHFSRDAFAPLTGSPPQAGPATERRERGWKDTASVRLGSEWNAGEHWMVSAGVGLEPSPIPRRTVEPGFALGDALVYGTGITYRIRDISFDLGYSYFQYDSRDAGGQELQHPQVTSTYKTRDQVFGFSISWGK
jgi:long-chain fatty acid transport protein